MAEAIGRALAHHQGRKVTMGIARPLDPTCFHVEASDILSNRVPCWAGIAPVMSIDSALGRQSVVAGLMIPGDLSIRREIASMRPPAASLREAMGNGARRALIPPENGLSLHEVSGGHRGAGRSPLLLR